MQTLTIEILNEKAIPLFDDLEGLNLIKIIEKNRNNEVSMTDLQKFILTGPVATDEDIALIEEKRKN